MNSIYKYQIDILDLVVIHTHPIVRWLHVDVQHGCPCVWAEVDTSGPMDSRFIVVRGTGHPMTGKEGRHIGTFQTAGGALVFHVFEDDS